MTPDKWNELKTKIQDSFKGAEISREILAEPEIGERETILFDGPLGQMKLEYFSRPLVLDKITHGSRRIGSTPGVEYVYSETEKTHQLKVYKWDDNQNDWLEIDLRGSFNL